VNMVGKSPYIQIIRMTMEGHKFLDNARNDKAWINAKEEIQNAGFKTVSITVISEILSKIIKKIFNLE